MNTKITLWIVATTCAIGATTPRAVAQTQTVRFENIQDVVTDWNPNQHLYVHGDLGVGAPQLAELERWLDDHAPHWLIVLMQSADGQTYVSADGQRYRGMDAVEIALGPGLQNNTPIGRWTNPRSGETDAAVFVLYLRERKFSYFASDAQDRRGLGESHWIGELDQPAIRAMRGGGRIIDAVKDTVNNINSELEKQIDREIGQAERAARERARAVEECKDEIKLTRDQISNVITRRDDLRTQFPNAKGSLVTPPTDQWLASLETQQAELSDENVRERANAIDLIRDDVVRTLNDYADHAAWPTAVAAIQSRMNNLQNELDGFATDSIDVARQKLTEASNAHDNADPGFMDLYHDAAGKLDDAERLIAAERQRLASQAARHQLIVQSIIATLAVTLLAIMVVLFILNRRRRGAHDRAIDALDQRQKAVRAEMEHVLQLMQRSSEILGSREKVAERGYSGQTKKLCDETFDHVDDLLIMSGEVERVMDEATELIHPNDIAAKAVNMFSSARYEQGINRISGETLRFHRDRGLPQIVKDTTDSGEDPPEEVGLTFEQVFSSFRDHNKSASELLNTLETSLVEVNDRLRALRADIDALSETEQQLSKAHQHDGFFDIRNLFDTLIPSIEKDFDEADDVSATDPVRATQVFIPSATRKIRDALAINSVITLARNEIFPEFNKHAPRLRTLEYATEWIQTQVDSLGTTADTLVRDAAQRDIASDTSNLEASMRDLQARVQTSAALAEQLQTEFAPAIEALETDIAHTRDTVAQSLKIDAALALHEHDLDPDVSLGRARQQFAAAQAALHQGGTSAAADAVSAIQQALQSGRTIVADTAEALRTFDDTVRLRLKDYGDLRDQIPSHERQLESTRTQYATAALRLQAADAAYPDPRATLETHMIGTREHVTNIEELIERANRWGKQGRLLAASALLRQASLGTQEGKQLLNEMEKHIATRSTRGS
ncbi:MAG: hypothetical protein KDA99_17810, partial [Planctomycetales bacterium]|nr:hypothetical protein [Planctomycetales bacterium]